MAVFAVLVTAGPLAFGAVDRFAQIALVALLTVGVVALPPVLTPLGGWGKRLVVALLVVLVLKEFLPPGLFGHTLWRTEVTQNLGLALPPTHNPEPARALDAFLATLVAVVWFLWVRTLAADPERRQMLSWSLFIGAVLVAVVSFATRDLDPQAIYGLRYTPGWVGFGPFPNRNHSATLFAMGGVIGLGCSAWAWVRRKRLLFAVTLVFTGLLVAALLETESRGGLVAFTAGVAFFIGFTFLKVRSRTVIFSGVAILLVLGALTAAFGSKVLTRFQPPVAGQVSTEMRVAVWQDALGMWRDALLFGHGTATFPQVFPLYQKLDAEEIVVLHPESSWLQWLTELGLVPVLLAVVALGLFLAPHVRAALARNRTFYLRASALTAFGVLLFHSIFDVPAHRWGTAGFALAALALACPLDGRPKVTAGSRRMAAVLAVIAGFWAAPFFFDVPASSPSHLKRLLARDAEGADVRMAEYQRSLRWFPLNAWLHQGLATRQLNVDGRARPGPWQRHYAIASRLLPAAWTVPAAQARACARIAPEAAIGYWQQAVDRGRLHRWEILGTALSATEKSPLAASAWARYAELNPDLLLAYAATLPDEEARYFYNQWWEQRSSAANLTEPEIENFHRQVVRLGSLAQFEEWMQRHPDRQEGDFRAWAAVLHRWGDDERAWEMLAKRIPEPGFPAGLVSVQRVQLEAKWRLMPTDHVNAQHLVQLLNHNGATTQSDEIILAVAAQTKTPPPPWFTRKAAYIYFRLGQHGEAVAALLASK